jgi:hypothetical protein
MYLTGTFISRNKETAWIPNSSEPCARLAGKKPNGHYISYGRSKEIAPRSTFWDLPQHGAVVAIDVAEVPTASASNFKLEEEAKQ